MYYNNAYANIGRNQACPCGSGKKYKHCHLKKADVASGGMPGKNRFIQRSKEFVTGMVTVCRLARRTLEMIEPYLVPGATTGKINTLLHEYMLDNRAVPATLNYKGYRKSSCISLNDVVCHGIPNHVDVIKEGDIVNVDVTPILDGYHGDTSKTFLIGECGGDAKKITDVSRSCLDIAIKKTRPYMRVGDIGHRIQRYAESMGCSVVEDFVGHSIGRHFHEDPQIPHFGKKNTGEILLPGMFFTIEPMINLGEKYVKIEPDGWTAKTKDGSLSAQYEHTVMVTKTRLRPLTDESDDQPIFSD